MANKLPCRTIFAMLSLSSPHWDQWVKSDQEHQHSMFRNADQHSEEEVIESEYHEYNILHQIQFPSTVIEERGKEDKPGDRLQCSEEKFCWLQLSCSHLDWKLVWDCLDFHKQFLQEITYIWLVELELKQDPRTSCYRLKMAFTKSR